MIVPKMGNTHKKGETMVNTNKLRGKMKELGWSVEKLAPQIGISPTSMYRILAKDGKCFTVAQVEKIKELLNLDTGTVVEIFLA